MKYLMFCFSINFCSLEIKQMQKITHEHFEKISIEHDKSTKQLEAQRIELEQREKELQRRAVQNENERLKLHREKMMVTYFFFLKDDHF